MDDFSSKGQGKGLTMHKFCDSECEEQFKTDIEETVDLSKACCEGKDHNDEVEFCCNCGMML